MISQGQDDLRAASAIRQGSTKKRKVEDIDSGVEDASNQVRWENLFRELQAERITKAEELLHAHVRECEEREKLMRSYNQELESENQALRSKLATEPEQQQQLQELQTQLKDLQSKLSVQNATIQAYQKLTGTTLSNVCVNDEDDIKHFLECECTVQNTESKTTTRFQISTVFSSDKANEEDTRGAILKYRSLENPHQLPEFLHEEIEFESSQLPPLLQNVLRGMFPEED